MTRLARASDPQTSVAAAEKVPKFAWTHEHAIEHAMWRPMIAPELAKLTGLSIEQVCRRLPYMKDKVELSGVERDGYREWRRVV